MAERADAPRKLDPDLSLAAAAKLLNVPPSAVHTYTADGRLPVHEHKGRARYVREDVLRLLDELTVQRNGPPHTFPVVGIGAAAGGPEAVAALLGALRPDLGLAYVVVAHEAADSDRLRPQALQPHTAMPVHPAEHGTLLEPDHVYVVAPDTHMSLVDGVLTTQEPRTDAEGGVHPINTFLVSLAEAYQMNAVGILLSGTATDGVVGLKAIRAGGGWTFAQDDSARHPDMPHHAQEAGAVDFVLAPEHIARQLADLRHHPVAELAITNKPLPQDTRALHEVLVLLHRRRGVDFTQYKQSTINRRILRRMLLHRAKDLADYAKRLANDAAELDLLFEDLLINVTLFFREPKFFEALKQRVFPLLLKGRPAGDPLRIWVAGCSSGEEPVSIAITLLEHFQDELRAIPVQLFSTDLDASVVEKARRGIYGKVALESVAPHLLKKYFTRAEGGFQVAKAIRDMCVFAEHDLLKDPPFSRIDLVSCQNVLIYLEGHAQQKVLRNFHYALKNEGLLALGRSETVGLSSDLYQQVDKEHKVYVRRGARRPLPMDVVLRSATHARRHAVVEGTEEPVPTGEHELDREAEKLLLHRHVPASVVVNKDLEIVRFRGATAPYMAPHAGRASLHLLKMVREELVFELRNLLRRVRTERAPLLRSGLELQVNGRPRVVNIEVAPLRVSLEEEHYLVVFLDDAAPGALAGPEASAATNGKQAGKDAKDRRIALLERELRDVRDQMRMLVEEAEANAEELQTANEEVLSSNEELQSMNEELETSKEELQSTNEELTTINDELLRRQEELKDARDYADGIISTLEAPLVILNANMRVRSANAAFYRTFHTTREDTEGVLIHELGNHQWDVTTLRKQLFDVLTHGTEMRDFEVTHTFPHIGDRTMLLSAKRIEHLGVQQRILITMADITERRRAEKALIRLATIVTSSEDAILSMDLQGRVLTWNEGATRLYGYTGTEMEGRTLEALMPPDRLREEEQLVARVARGEAVGHYETVRIRKDGTPVQVSLTLSPMYAADGTLLGISKTSRDITQMRATESTLRETERRFHLLADHMDQLAWITAPDGTTIWLNKRWEEYTGIAPTEVAERRAEIHHPDHLHPVRASWEAAQREKRPWEYIMPLKGRDGNYRWFLARAVPQCDDAGHVELWFGTCTDITDRMRAEEALKEADRRKDEFLATLAHELRNPLAPLRSGLDILSDIPADPIVQQTRSVMERQVVHMVRLVDDLLDLGRISAGRLRLILHPTDLRTPVDVAVEGASAQLHARGQHLHVERSTRPLLVDCDATRITQVVSNLLHNASKFSPEGATIRLTVNKVGHEAVIHVQDPGIGIEREEQQRVFDMFTQVDPEERARAGGGLGIGLHIVSRLVHMHGGAIAVHSDGKGKGSTFVVSLPLLREAAPEVRTPKTRPMPRPQRILVVDDSNDNAVMLSMLLRALECETRVANSGADALRIGETFRPEVIFMDLSMPGMDGYETCRQVRRTNWGAAAHIVALSGWGHPSDRQHADVAGFDAHVVKPVERSTLLDLLDRVEVGR